MQKRSIGMMGILIMPMLLSGCSRIGEKAATASVIYGVMAVISLLMLIGYCSLVPKKDAWILLLFIAIPIVNWGYFFLSESVTLSSALWANRIAYLGSVMLPLSMLMSILKVSGLKYPAWLPGLLLGVSIVVFFVAASQGYLDIYYAKVSLERVDGISVLNKVYGPWHRLYLLYLLAYFTAMIVLVIYAGIRREMESGIYSGALTVIVFANILVWLLEQLVKIDFEILSVTYTISELFLLCLFLLLQKRQNSTQMAQGPVQESILVEETPDNSFFEEESVTPMLTELTAEQNQEPADQNSVSEFCPPAQGEKAADEMSPCMEIFSLGLHRLTRTERLIYDHYIDGKTTKEIMESLQIKENTLKFHNKNIYSKLGVSSRKQLMNIAMMLKKE